MSNRYFNRSEWLHKSHQVIKPLCSILVSIALAGVLSMCSALPAFAACGASNAGWLPWDTRSRAGYSFNQYDYCGKTRTRVGVSPSTTWSSCDSTGGAGGWQPKRSSVCKNEVFTEVCSRWNKERKVYGTSNGSNWTPNANTVPEGQTFTQTSDCGSTRSALGTKVVCQSGSWEPAADSICQGVSFSQNNSCSTRSSVGTKDCSSAGEIAGNPNADDRRHAETIWTTTPQGDEGFFQFGGTSLNETILYNSNRNTIIRRYLSANGNPYRLWIDDNEPGGFGVNLKDRESFDVWLNYMDHPNQPNLHWCELVEANLGGWTPTGAVPTACGTHTITEARTCGAGAAVRPCPYTCPNGELSQSETRTTTIDNGACTCTDPWLPARSSVCSGDAMVQMRCSESRNTRGTKNCVPIACSSAYEPASNTVCSGVAFTQIRCDGLPPANRRGSIGTMNCSVSGGSPMSWQYNTTVSISPFDWGTVNINGRLCQYWAAGANGTDKQRKMQQHPSLSGTDYACYINGQTDYCYFEYFEPNPSGGTVRTDVDRVNFVCQST